MIHCWTCETHQPGGCLLYMFSAVRLEHTLLFSSCSSSRRVEFASLTLRLPFKHRCRFLGGSAVCIWDAVEVRRRRGICFPVETLSDPRPRRWPADHVALGIMGLIADKSRQERPLPPSHHSMLRPARLSLSVFATVTQIPEQF